MWKEIVKEEWGKKERGIRIKTKKKTRNGRKSKGKIRWWKKKKDDEKKKKEDEKKADEKRRQVMEEKVKRR